ncbi:flavin monoamine oxidase family protein [Rubrimonas sp.]|uniref:flavin monoamine oxidase family protein n=1 Tax=Rubrimonas sp. TaxID=2036015 RepID=UPI002FDE2832
MVATAGALAATAPARAPARPMPTDPDVAIIGAGSAGIAAARRLMAAGRSVVVIEAADRIGGRAFTESATFGVPYDHGCAWLQGPRDLPHMAVARDLGFAVVDHANAGEAFFIDGARADRSEQARLDRTTAAIHAAAARAGDVSVASVIPQDLPRSAEAQTWLANAYAVDMADCSTADMAAYGDYEVDCLIREGLGALVAHLGRDLPVKLGAAARVVDWSGQGVRVETTAGTVAARACVVTVSTGVLGSGAIRFKPDLPPAQAQAAADVPMGLLTKIALQFDGARFGLRENDWLSYALPPEIPARACYFVTFPAGLDLAVGFVGGAFAWDLAAAGADAAIDFALGEFVGAVGSEARRHFVKGHMTDWHANPLTLGAYAAARPGRHAARAALAAPLGDRVFFAGEALAVPLAALCSGAHLSGEAAADAALAALAAREGCGGCDARGRQLRRLGGADE